MARYEDLSPYAYAQDSVPDGVEAVNVGWLEDDSFPEGDVPDEFTRSLALLCRDEPRMRMRGWQGCLLRHPEGKPGYPVMGEVEGEELSLGDAEVRVVACDGRWLIAPNLVLHYVTAHSYRPPEEFIEAVSAMRTASAAVPRA